MTDQEIQTTILRELRELRGSFEAYTANMEQRVSTLETHMERLVAPRPVLVTSRRKGRQS
jgi:hypothetical protein